MGRKYKNTDKRERKGNHEGFIFLSFIGAGWLQVVAVAVVELPLHTDSWWICGRMRQNGEDKDASIGRRGVAFYIPGFRVDIPIYRDILSKCDTSICLLTFNIMITRYVIFLLTER